MATSTALIAILGGLGLVTRPLRRWVGDYLVTIAHEGGHAVATMLCSGRVLGIRLHTQISADRTGVAGVTHSRTGGRARVLVGLAGYPAPAAIGLATLALLHADHTRGALATMVFSLAVMLIFIRNVFGALLLLTVGTGLYVAFLYGSTTVQGSVVGIIAWALLFGATRDTVEAFRSNSGDAAGLSAITRVPAKLWSTLFVLATAAATVYAGWLTLTTWT
jgi:hypothetical protein